MGEELTFKDGEDAAQNEINEKGFDLELWNEFLEHPADFEALFSDVLIGKPKTSLLDTGAITAAMLYWRTPKVIETTSQVGVFQRGVKNSKPAPFDTKNQRLVG